MTIKPTLTLADRKRLREIADTWNVESNDGRYEWAPKEVIEMLPTLLDALDEADRLLAWARKPSYFCPDCHSHHKCKNHACPCSDCFQEQTDAYLAHWKAR